MLQMTFILSFFDAELRFSVAAVTITLPFFMPAVDESEGSEGQEENWRCNAHSFLPQSRFASAHAPLCRRCHAHRSHTPHQSLPFFVQLLMPGLHLNQLLPVCYIMYFPLLEFVCTLCCPFPHFNISSYADFRGGNFKSERGKGGV